MKKVGESIMLKLECLLRANNENDFKNQKADNPSEVTKQNIK